MKPFLALSVLLFMLSACGKKEDAAPPPAASLPPPAQAERAAPAAKPEPPVAPAQTSSVSADQAAPRSDKVVVAKGDTLYSIARKHGLNQRDLAQWNNIRDPRRLRVGQELRLEAPGK